VVLCDGTYQTGGVVIHSFRLHTPEGLVELVGSVGLVGLVGFVGFVESVELEKQGYVGLV
jgi:hypothetical protein